MYEFFKVVLTISSIITFMMALVLLLVYFGRKDEDIKNIVLPTVSVFVPFYNEDRKIFIKTLEKLNDQQYPDCIQVVLIDDGSTNETPSYVKSWLLSTKRHDFQLLTRKVNGGRKGYALDFALESEIATGEVYIVVDSDTYIESDGVYELAKKIWSEPRYAAVCGYISPENIKDSLLAKLQHYEHVGFYGAIRCAQDRLGLVPVLAGAFVAHRASVVKEIGGWSEWLVEDIAWCWRAIAHKYRTGYAPRAIASTQCPTTHKTLFNQRRRWARGRVEAYMATWKVSKLTGIVSTPWFMITAMQYLFPPSIILMPILIYTNILAPIFIGAATLFVYFLFFRIYIYDYNQKKNVYKNNIFHITFFTIILESIVWLPNILGYLDEVFRKRKSWLTR